MNTYTINLIHTENGYPEVRKRTLKIKEDENIIDVIESLYINPIEVVSVIDENTKFVSYIPSVININSLKINKRGVDENV